MKTLFTLAIGLLGFAAAWAWAEDPEATDCAEAAQIPMTAPAPRHGLHAGRSADCKPGPGAASPSAPVPGFACTCALHRHAARRDCTQGRQCGRNTGAIGGVGKCAVGHVSGLHHVVGAAQ